MGLVSDSIPNLIQGVSQQPFALRSPTQLDAQENCYSSVVEGLIQRPPTETVARISTTPYSNAFIHTINRTVDQRFKAVFTNGTVKVFDLDGVEHTVSTVDETLQIHSAVAVGAGQVYNIAPAPGETGVDFTVSGLGTATVTLQFSVNGSAWSDVATRTTNGTTADVTIGTNLFMRVNITAWTSGTVVATVTWKNMRYLVSTNPKLRIGAMTVADYTFVLNLDKVASMDETLSPVRDEEGLVFVAKGEYGSKYEIFIDEVSRADYTTSTTDVTTLSTTAIATQLYNDLVAWAGAGFTFTLIGSVIWIKKTSTFKLRTQDAQGGTSLIVFKGKTEKFSGLPAEAPDGFTIAIDADPTTDQGQYFVKAAVTQTGVAFGPVSWTECVRPGVQFNINPVTMPYTLIHNVDNTFTFQAVSWGDRVAGDTDTNLSPSFVGTTINKMAFYKNRLGFFADENFIFSEVGEYFNFFRTTITQLKDSDPVDSRATDINVSIIRQAVLFNKSLIMFSDQTQFEMPSTASLTPKTVTADVVSKFESLTDVAPLNAGKVINFLFSRENYVGMKELFVSNSNALILEAEEVSAHVPAYIPDGAFFMANSTLENVTGVLTDGDPGSIYIYKTTWKDEKKQQSAWFRWNFDDYTGLTCRVLSADFIGSTMYILIDRNGEVFIEKMRLLPNRTDPDSSYVTHIDRRITEEDLTSATYNSVTGQTTLTLPWNITSTQPIVVTRSVPDNSPYMDVGRQAQIVTATVGTPTIVVTGDWSTNPLWIGQRYLAQFDLSRIYVRDKTSGKIDPASVLQLLKGYVVYGASGAFIVRVIPEGGTTSDYIFTGRIVGDINNILGVVSLPSGRFPFSILKNNEHVQIQILSNAFLPFKITSIEWEGNYTKRSQGR